MLPSISENNSTWFASKVQPWDPTWETKNLQSSVFRFGRYFLWLEVTFKKLLISKIIKPLTADRTAHWWFLPELLNRGLSMRHKFPRDLKPYVFTIDEESSLLVPAITTEIYKNNESWFSNKSPANDLCLFILPSNVGRLTPGGLLHLVPVERWFVLFKDTLELMMKWK